MNQTKTKTKNIQRMMCKKFKSVLMKINPLLREKNIVPLGSRKNLRKLRLKDQSKWPLRKKKKLKPRNIRTCHHRLKSTSFLVNPQKKSKLSNVSHAKKRYFKFKNNTNAINVRNLLILIV